MLISHTRDIYMTLERGILRYVIPLYFNEERHLGKELMIEIDTLRWVSGLPRQQIDDNKVILRASLPVPWHKTTLPILYKTLPSELMALKPELA